MRTLFLICAWATLAPLIAEAASVEYNRDIRPILADACFSCHGADSGSRQAGLRLDQRDDAIAADAFHPGDPSVGSLIERVFSDDPDLRMPPPETKKTLTPEQKEILRRWIAEGAEYEPHWSLTPPVKAPPPQVSNPAWVRNPIDQFILARLDAAGLSPAPEADRRTLARRVALDLTGLPPSVDVVERFVADERPEAYETLVDQLLASHSWGEHRARYWLDYARYADTHGIHFDNYREMWSYRDWVIKAFNRNLPFDRFTIESLAGDLLPDADVDQQVASGFNRCHMTTNEGGIIDEEYLVLYTRDRTDTVAQVWMGLTAGCAVCHTHKFDPLSQKEFYELAAFFNNTTQPAKDGNIPNAPPIIDVPADADRPEWDRLLAQLGEVRTQIDERRIAARAEFERWLETARPDVFARNIPETALELALPLDAPGETAPAIVRGESTEVELSESARFVDQGPTGARAAEITTAPLAEFPDLGDFDSHQPFSVSLWVKLRPNDSGGALVARMDNDQNYRGWDVWVEGRRIGMHLIDSWSGNALKVVSRKQAPANQWMHVVITYDGSKKARGVSIYFNGEAQQTTLQADALQGTIKANTPLKIGQRSKESLAAGSALCDLRIYQRALSAGEAMSFAKSREFAEVLKKPAPQRTEEELAAIYNWYLDVLDEPMRASQQHQFQLESEQAALRSRGTIGYVMAEREEMPNAYILNRGEYDRREEQVIANTPEVLPPFPDDLPKNRLGLAQWLLLPEHPLTARVTVNRCWQEVFGTGLVKTSGDFGVMGELPSHPELLDWLAVHFVESGWDIKQLYKLMVMSATYRQRAVATPEKRERDPDNRLLSRGPRFRMDAEMVRDYVLAATGTLVDKIGGPSVKPYQPPGVWEAIAMNVSNTRSYQQGAGDDLYRRSLYTFVKRMAPPASLEIFNAPNREYCVVRRERTNTALQALAALNDVQNVEAARRLAEALLTERPDASVAERLDQIGFRCLSRPFRADEQRILTQSVEQLRTHYQQHAEAAQELISVGEAPVHCTASPAEIAAWTMIVNEVLNLDEALNK